MHLLVAYTILNGSSVMDYFIFFFFFKEFFVDVFMFMAQVTGQK